MDGKKLNWFYILTGVLLMAMLFISFKYFQGSRHSSVGITYARAYKINADKSAVIKTIPVIPGQQIKAGDLMVELTSADMEIDIHKLENRIALLRADLNEKLKLADSEISYIKAEQGIKIEDVNADIVQAESELQLNKKLTKEFVSSSDSSRGGHPVQLKINSLKKQKTRLEEASAIKVKEVLQRKETEQRLSENQIELLERELKLLYSERKKLSKYAVSDGVVDNVYVKEGEQVDAYAPLLSLNPAHPTTVVGYLVGKKENLPVGSEVSVRSYEQGKSNVAGKVIGYGSVVQLPDILQKSTAVKAFGREIFIEIAPINDFATGEKVLIR